MKLPNGFGTVRKLSGTRRQPWAALLPATYELDIATQEVKTTRKYLSFHVKKEEAIAALVDYNKNPQLYNTRQLTFANVYEMWSKEKFPVLKSIEGYQNGYRHCALYYNMSFCDLRLMHLQKIIDDCPYGYGAQHYIKTLLNQIYKYAMAHDIVEKNYATFIKIDKKEVKLKRVLFTAEEIAAIDKAAEDDDNWIAGVVLACIYTGMRKSEILTVKKENIFFDKRYMLGGVKTAAGIDRIIPIHRKIEHIIKGLYDKSDVYLLDFIKSKAPDTYIGASFEKFMGELNIKHTTHDCRNTFVSRMHELNAPLLEVKRIIGHSSRDITEAIYTKIEAKKLVEVVDKLYY